MILFSLVPKRPKNASAAQRRGQNYARGSPEGALVAGEKCPQSSDAPLSPSPGSSASRDPGIAPDRLFGSDEDSSCRNTLDIEIEVFAGVRNHNTDKRSENKSTAATTVLVMPTAVMITLH